MKIYEKITIEILTFNRLDPDINYFIENNNKK